jgi:hypothetical protein
MSEATRVPPSYRSPLAIGTVVGGKLARDVRFAKMRRMISAVVAVEDDESVFSQPAALQRPHEIADLLVHRSDHSGISAAIRVADVRIHIRIFLRHLEWCVRSGECQIKEEGLSRVLPIDISNGVFAQ